MSYIKELSVSEKEKRCCSCYSEWTEAQRGPWSFIWVQTQLLSSLNFKFYIVKPIKEDMKLNLCKIGNSNNSQTNLKS